MSVLRLKSNLPHLTLVEIETDAGIRGIGATWFSHHKIAPLITDGQDRLDRVLESVRKKIRIEGRFVIPGETPIAAAVDHARTVARRAERSVVGCVDAGLIAADPILPWLNRVSDVLFVLARAAERAPLPSKTIPKKPARRPKRRAAGSL